MLEVYVAKSRGVSKEEAAKEVHDFVETIKNELLEKGIYPIEGLGLLKRDQRGSLTFTLARPEEIKTPSSKSPISMQKPPMAISSDEISDDKKDTSLEGAIPTEETEVPIKKSRKISETKVKVEKPPVTKKSTKSSKMADEVNQEPIQETVQEPIAEPKKESIPTPEPLIISSPKPILETKPTEKVFEAGEKKERIIEKETPTYIDESIADEENNRRGLSGFVYTAIIVAIIVVLVLIVKYYYLPPNVDSITDSLTTIKTQDLLKNEVEVKDKIDKPKDEIDRAYNEIDNNKAKAVETHEQLRKEEAQEESIKNNLIKNSQKTTVSGVKFYIIAGSFKNPTFAENYLTELKKSGYNPSIVVQSSGMHAVAIGFYNSREEANKAMKKFKEKLPNLWVLKK